MKKQIWAGVASVPERVEHLDLMITSILPQVDWLGVYLDGYDEIPDFLHDPKIEVVMSQLYKRDLGDAGKFLWVDNCPGFYLACDDDLIYPPNYADNMIKFLFNYDNEVIVSLHGRIFNEDNTETNYHCLRHVDENVVVHLVGTGVAAFYAPKIGISIDDFQTPNIADYWLAKYANENQIPLVVSKHDYSTLVYMLQTTTIWGESSKKTGSKWDTHCIRNLLKREIKWKLYYPETNYELPTEDIVVSIVTYNRPELLTSLLDELEREMAKAPNSFNFQVRIYDDHSENYDGIRDLVRSKCNYTYYRTPQNYGRDRHWELISKELDDLGKEDADWYFLLPDDINLCDNFFVHAIAVWENLKDPTALNLAHHSGRSDIPCWTGVMPVEHTNGVEVAWIDGLYMCRRRCLDLLDFRVERVGEAWLKNRDGSGVGHQISNKLHRQGQRLYRVKSSLAYHGDNPSQMHPLVRLRDSQTSVDFLGNERSYFEIGEARISCSLDDHMARALGMGEFYEQDLLEAIAALEPEGIAIDVGAHIGNHTVYLALNTDLSYVYSIEPNASSFVHLTNSVEYSGVRDKVFLWRGAVHDEWINARLVPGPTNNSGMSGVESGGTIPVLKLDNEFTPGDIGLIKIDAERHSFNALKSADRILRNQKPIISIESQTEEEWVRVAKYLTPLGYECSEESYGWTPTWIWTKQ